MVEGGSAAGGARIVTNLLTGQPWNHDLGAAFRSGAFGGVGGSVVRQLGGRLGDAGRGVRQGPAAAHGLGAFPGEQMPGHAAVSFTPAATVGMLRWAPNGVPGG
ncbi:MAG: hypothetical protein ACLFVO_28875, partial [Chloroflexaceae bacterium]